MVKTTPLNEETHKCLKVAQAILYERYNLEISIPEIIATMIYDADELVKAIVEKKGLGNIQLIQQEELIGQDSQ